MISLKLLFFAAYREQLDCQELSYTCPANTCISELKQQLAQQGDSWLKVFNAPSMLVAVNQELVDDDYQIADNDEIAFFPPVTGG